MSGEKKIDPKWKRLDLLGEKWSALKPTGDEAARSALEDEIYILTWEIYSRPPRGIVCDQDQLEEAVLRFFENDWSKTGFHPERGKNGKMPLSAFVSTRVKFRLLKVIEEEHKKGVNGEPIIEVSFEDANSDTDGIRLEECIADPKLPDHAEQIVKQEGLIEAISIILNISERLSGRKNNPVTRNYYRMFFTHDVTEHSHEKEIKLSYRHERDLFQAMKVEFLDFYMAHVCRSLAAMTACPLRPYGELVEGKAMEECRLPLPGDVYCSYLERKEQYKATQSAVSQQYTAYYNFLQKELGVG